MKISVVIITFNEERNIARCINSVKAVADEVVVVDSFSTDRTEQLARSLGARFITHAFRGHIGQKNWATAQATHHWVLSLDADEALDPLLEASVLRVKQGPKADGYTMNRLTNYCGTWVRHGGWYPDVKLRLWDRRKGRWSGVDPHDRYELDAGCRTEHLPGELLHYSFYSVEEHQRQAAKFAELAAHAQHARGKRSGLHLILFSPVVRFLQGWLLRGGFLDGKAGWNIAVISARAKRMKYARLAELNRRGK